jgi:hypothetical protein
MLPDERGMLGADERIVLLDDDERLGVATRWVVLVVRVGVATRWLVLVVRVGVATR